MASAKPYIRAARRTDVHHILAMICELAGFEKAADKVEATEQSLSDTLTFAPCPSDPHPPQRYATTLLLCLPGANGSAAADLAVTDATPADEQVIGMAMYFHNYSTWRGVPGVYLEDLFIRIDHRRKGYATLLLGRLARIALEVSNGSGRLEWNCLKWNEGALTFYDGIGGERMDEWVGIRVEGKEKLESLAKMAEDRL